MKVKVHQSLKSFLGRGEVNIEVEADTLEEIKTLLEYAGSVEMKMS